jgi:hypothetical protein
MKIMILRMIAISFVFLGLTVASLGAENIKEDTKKIVEKNKPHFITNTILKVKGE